MDKQALIQFATAIFAILNPIGGVAIFAGMVAGRPKADQRATAIKGSIAVAVILIGSVWVGDVVMKFFGISVASLQVAGGLMIAMISVSMLKSHQSPIHDSKTDDSSSEPEPDIAVVPLAMPMVAGPGAIVTVIVTGHGHPGVASHVEMSVVCAVMAGFICMCFLGSRFISKILGTKGMEILTKFMGMLLLAIAAGMLADGVKGLLPGLAAAS